MCVIFISLLTIYNFSLELSRELLDCCDSRCQYFTVYFYVIRTSPSQQGSSSPLQILSDSLQLLHPTRASPSKDIICQSQGLPPRNQDKLLVIGAASFLGSQVAVHLHRNGTKVLAFEDVLSLSNNSLLWYRWKKVLSEGIPIHSIDLSNSSEVCELLKRTSPHTIIYVPTLLFDGHQVNDIDNIKQIITSYESFLILVKAVREFTLTKLVLLTLSATTASIQSSWLRAFEQTLLAYHNSHHLKVGVVSVDKVYGPWKEPIRDPCWYIDDFNDIVMGVAYANCSLQIRNLSCRDPSQKVSHDKGSALLTQWLTEYHTHLQQQNRVVVVSTYFTMQRNRQYKITFNDDNFRFLEGWFLGLYKLRLPMIVFHDSLSEAFTSQITTMCPLIEFILVTDFRGRAANDERFFLYYEYLINHPEVSHIIMTDLRDVKVLSNPFEVFKVLGDMVYVGLDRPFFVTSTGSSNDHFYPRCLPGINFEWEKDLLGSYNAGVLGGSRSFMLSVLTHLIRLLDLNIAENCNMPALFYALHRYYFESVFYGWPYQVGFDTQQVQVVSNCIVHKYPPVLPGKRTKRRKKP